MRTRITIAVAATALAVAGLFGGILPAAQADGGRAAQMALAGGGLDIDDPQIPTPSARALRYFERSTQEVVDSLLAGNITVRGAGLALLACAEDAGFTHEPLQRFQDGRITQDQALGELIATAAQVSPAYIGTADGFSMGAISAEEATLNFLYLAASTRDVPTAADLP